MAPEWEAWRWKQNLGEGEGRWQNEERDEEVFRQKYQGKLLLLKSQSHQMERHLCSLFRPPSMPLFSLLLCSYAHDSVGCIASLSIALKEKPLQLDGEQSRSRWHCADQCSHELKRVWGCWSGAVNSVLPWYSLTESNPFRSSPGRESEVWQSPALSVRSSPMSFKLLQMCGESRHGAGPGWDGWLTGRGVLNLPFNNSRMNPSSASPLFAGQAWSKPTHKELRHPRPGGYFQNWYGRIRMLYALLFCAGQAAKRLISPDVVFLGFCPNALQKERRGSMRNVIYFHSHFP